MLNSKAYMSPVIVRAKKCITGNLDQHYMLFSFLYIQIWLSRCVFFTVCNYDQTDNFI